MATLVDLLQSELYTSIVSWTPTHVTMSAETEAAPQASTSAASATAGAQSKPSMIPIRLTSRADKHAIPESKFMVPSDWKRFQLSELINRVLENEQVIPFDFLIGDELLRTSLGGYTQSKGLTEVNSRTYYQVEGSD